MKKAFIIVNTGSPAELTQGSAKTFLREFLSDYEVLSLAFFIRYPLARRIAAKRAGAYLENLEKIAIDGKPRLRVVCENLAKHIFSITAVDTFAAYRYGGDLSIAEAIHAARALGARDFRFIPMFPQSASSTTLSIKKEIFLHRREGEIFRFQPRYFDDEMYIACLKKSFEQYGDIKSPVLASFHSVPLSHNAKTNYSVQCARTAELLAEAAGLADVAVVWQSKMGKCAKWLEPSTAETIVSYAKGGVETLNIICPGFACDCTETLVEVDCDLRRLFLQSGGKTFNYIPCLNDTAEHAVMFSEIFERMK